MGNQRRKVVCPSLEYQFLRISRWSRSRNNTTWIIQLSKNRHLLPSHKSLVVAVVAVVLLLALKSKKWWSCSSRSMKVSGPLAIVSILTNCKSISDSIKSMLRCASWRTESIWLNLTLAVWPSLTMQQDLPGYSPLHLTPRCWWIVARQITHQTLRHNTCLRATLAGSSRSLIYKMRLMKVIGLYLPNWIKFQSLHLWCQTISNSAIKQCPHLIRLTILWRRTLAQLHPKMTKNF